MSRNSNYTPSKTSKMKINHLSLAFKSIAQSRRKTTGNFKKLYYSVQAPWTYCKHDTAPVRSKANQGLGHKWKVGNRRRRRKQANSGAQPGKIPRRSCTEWGDFYDTFTNDKGKDFLESKNAASISSTLLLNPLKFLNSHDQTSGHSWWSTSNLNPGPSTWLPAFLGFSFLERR